jgi:RHS repeat-associated protein
LNMKYDSHNRLSEYTVTGDRKIALRYDPVSRVFRREVYTGALLNTLESAVHYYYQGGEMVQEFDEMLEGEPEIQTPIDAINWDYLRGYHGEVIRRREVDGETYTDMLQVVDHQGSVKQEASPDVSGTVGASNGYATHAEGEPLPIEQPSDIANHIQFHGGILEDSNIHTNPATDGEMGYFYRMGVRHYSPGLHRFIQRDPLSYIRVPGRSTPLSLNPYVYGMNRPDQLSDVSGYQANPWGIMPMPCPGCFSPEGGGSGTDGGQGPIIINRQRPGNGNGTPTPEADDEPVCMKEFPQECIISDPGVLCGLTCCYNDHQPEWEGCCPKGTVSGCVIDPKYECVCACCLDGGGENSPEAVAPTIFDFNEGSTTFGPPSIGPFGNGGGMPWDNMPISPLSELFKPPRMTIPKKLDPNQQFWWMNLGVGAVAGLCKLFVSHACSIDFGKIGWIGGYVECVCNACRRFMSRYADYIKWLLIIGLIGAAVGFLIGFFSGGGIIGGLYSGWKLGSHAARIYAKIRITIMIAQLLYDLWKCMLELEEDLSRSLVSNLLEFI